MKHGVFCSITLVIILFAFCSIPNTAENTSEKVVLLESSTVTDKQVLELSEIARDIAKPIVIYSYNPDIFVTENSRSSCYLDFKSGNMTEEVVAWYAVTQYRYKYTVIEPWNEIREYEFIRETDNTSRFDLALQKEIQGLRNRTDSVTRQMILSSYSGDELAYAEHWFWKKEVEREISAIDEDDDGYTWETTLKRDVWRSINNYEGYPEQALYWLSEWRISTAFDGDDYKADYLQWVGPWVTSRWLKYTEDNLDIYDWGPTSSVGSWSYSFSTGIKINGQGPEVSFGLSQTWTQSEVEIIDDTSDVNDIAEWTETFTGPTYFWFPLLDEPCTASYNTYLSRRGVEWCSDRVSMTGTQKYKATVVYDTDFVYLIVGLVFTRYTTYVSYTKSVDYPGPSAW